MAKGMRLWGATLAPPAGAALRRTKVSGVAGRAASDGVTAARLKASRTVALVANAPDIAASAR